MKIKISQNTNFICNTKYSHQKVESCAITQIFQVKLLTTNHKKYVLTSHYTFLHFCC